MHGSSRQIELLAGVGNAPDGAALVVFRLLVDDERPLGFVWQNVEGIRTRGNILAADDEVAVGNKERGLVRARAPDFAVGYEVAVNLALVHARTGIIDLDGLAVVERK